MVIKTPDGKKEIIYVRPCGRGVCFPFENYSDFEDIYGEGIFEIQLVRHISANEFKQLSEKVGVSNLPENVQK